MARSQIAFHVRALVGRTNRIVILSGSPVRTDNVELLASMLEGDQLALKLERAVGAKSSLVALSLDDRRRIVDVLAADAPGDSPSSEACS